MVIENSFLFLRKFSVQSYELRPNHVGHSIKSQFDDFWPHHFIILKRVVDYLCCASDIVLEPALGSLNRTKSREIQSPPLES